MPKLRASQGHLLHMQKLRASQFLQRDSQIISLLCLQQMGSTVQFTEEGYLINMPKLRASPGHLGYMLKLGASQFLPRTSQFMIILTTDAGYSIAYRIRTNTP